MIIAVNISLLVLTVILGLAPFLLAMRFRARLSGYGHHTALRYAPAIAAILPCKGLDPGFRDNIQALLDQDYPSLQLLFVVATEEDPAYPALREILHRQHGRKSLHTAELIVAGIDHQRAQKLTNQLAALRNVSRDTEVIVFLDSDIRPDREFLRRLVAPLDVQDVGATTGFRWYHPPAPTVGSMLRSAWNAGALPFLVDPKRNFAWGGAMAIRRKIFDRAGIAAAWEHAVSDDFPFTLGVRALGLEVRFVPECIAISYEASTLSETIEFTNRQSVISRVYFPPLWRAAAIGHSVGNLMSLYGAANLLLWLSAGGLAHLLGAGCLLLIPLQMAGADNLFRSVKTLIPQLDVELDKLRWRYVLTAPLASLLSLVNTLYSLTTRRITWRGITYELRSPRETVVCESDR
ncbi:MAG: glycosyltransferase [Gammaproteobacteria bacterium]